MGKLSNAKIFGGLGALLLFIGSFVPYLNFVLPLVGLVLVFIAVKYISDETKDNSIFSNFLINFILTVIAFVALIAGLIITIGSVGILSELEEELSDVETALSFIGGIFILIGGLIVSDFLGDIVETVGEEAHLVYSSVMGAAVRFFLYYIALILSLTVMKVDVFILQIVAIAIAITVAIGVGGAVAIAFGFGLREYVAKNAHVWFGPEEHAKRRAKRKRRN